MQFHGDLWGGESLKNTTTDAIETESIAIAVTLFLVTGHAGRHNYIDGFSPPKAKMLA